MHEKKSLCVRPDPRGSSGANGESIISDKIKKWTNLTVDDGPILFFKLFGRGNSTEASPHLWTPIIIKLFWDQLITTLTRCNLRQINYTNHLCQWHSDNSNVIYFNFHPSIYLQLVLYENWFVLLPNLRTFSLLLIKYFY